MLIATDPLSLVFIACFLFGLLFLLVTTLLGSLGHAHIGHAGSHAVAPHGGLHVGGHASLPHAGGTHVVSHAPQVGSHGTTPTAGQGVQPQQAGSQNAQGSDFSIFMYINPTSVVLFLLGFGFFGYVFHNTTQLMLPLTLAFAGVGGIVIAALMLLTLWWWPKPPRCPPTSCPPAALTGCGTSSFRSACASPSKGKTLLAIPISKLPSGP